MRALFILAILCVAAPLAAAQLAYETIDAFPNLSAFSVPTDIQALPDGSGRLAVVERRGRIQVVANDPAATQKALLLDIEDRVFREPSWEEGLLGLAFHPEYDQNGQFFVHYTGFPLGPGEPHRSIIARFDRDPEGPLEADPDSEHVILTLDQPGPTHNGGQLVFGPPEGPNGRRYLYLSFGDGAGPYDPFGHAQDRTTLLGTVLRIDVDAPDRDLAYGVPDDNPFVGNAEGWREEIWAFGFRNPWRFSFDPPTGRLWLGDVGQGMREEVNLVTAAGNYGWDLKEGTLCIRDPEPGEPDCDSPELIDPIWEYPHSDGNGSITGGLVYRGTALPDLVGTYVYGDFLSGRVWGLTYDEDSGPDNQLLAESGRHVTTFGLDDDGEILMGDLFGRVHRLVEAKVAVEPSAVAPSGRLTLAGPNPTTSRTAFWAEAPTGVAVRIEVVDVGGRVVGLAHEGPGGTAGAIISIDTSRLVSGVYLARLMVDGRLADSARFTVLR